MLESFDVFINGVPLVAVVMALVQFYGVMGVSGKAQFVSSLVTGILLGVGYMISVNGVPVDFAGWFGQGFYGLALGLMAAGVYNAANGKKSLI